MTEEVAALVVRLEATHQRLQKDLQRATTAINRWSRTTERRAENTARNVGRSMQRVGRQQAAAIQNAGFQVGDFFTQVASGQNALVAFTQQGTQLVSHWGPVGAIIGAAGAAAGALALTLADAGDETEEATDALQEMQDGLSRSESLMSALTDSANDYAAAVRNAAKVSTHASREIVAATLSEFNARQQLLRLELVPRREEIAASRERITELTNQLNTIDLQLSSRTTVPGPLGGLGPGGTLAPALSLNKDAADTIDDITNSIKRLHHESSIAEGSLDRLTKNAFASPSDIADPVKTGGSRGGRSGSGRRSRPTPSLELKSMLRTTFMVTRQMEEYEQSLEDAAERQEQLARGVAQVGDAFIRAGERADSFKDALKQIGIELLRLATNAAFGQGPFGGLINEVLGVTAGGVLGLALGASSNSFNVGSAVPGPSFLTQPAPTFAFAKGGVVNRPTTFSMPNATGLMGEAGPEAIMPLKRGPDGTLGVVGGRNVTVAPTYNISGVGLSAAEVAAVIENNNRKLPMLLRDAMKRGR